MSDAACTCDPEAYESGPEGQMRYFEDRGCPVHGDPEWIVATDRSVEATEGWTALEFYAFIVRTLGVPATFRLGETGWVADAPFTKPSADTLALLESHGV